MITPTLESFCESFVKITWKSQKLSWHENFHFFSISGFLIFSTSQSRICYVWEKNGYNGEKKIEFHFSYFFGSTTVSSDSPNKHIMARFMMITPTLCQFSENVTKITPKSKKLPWHHFFFSFSIFRFLRFVFGFSSRICHAWAWPVKNPDISVKTPRVRWLHLRNPPKL